MSLGGGGSTSNKFPTTTATRTKIQTNNMEFALNVPESPVQSETKLPMPFSKQTRTKDETDAAAAERNATLAVAGERSKPLPKIVLTKEESTRQSPKNKLKPARSPVGLAVYKKDDLKL